MSTSQTSGTGRADDMVDVAIVGYGPVGATLAVLLAQRGWRVVVLERWAEPYPLPRAVHFDHEAGRILQSCGIGEALTKISEPADIYEFQNAARKPLVRFGRVGNGLSGWPQSSMFSQPELEALLFARVGELSGIEVRRGVQVTAIEDDGAGVTVHGERVDIEPDGNGGLRLRRTGEAPPVRARYVVGCDGANSTVRNVIGLDMTDRAFFYDWLIVDVIFDEPRTFDPLNVQICDPARPTTCVSGGPGRRRWEFMALPGESIDQLNDEATAWRLLEPWDASPSNARLERHAVYRFQARWVQEWRRGRVLLAGDAAHQTPPFAGQGLCSGLRDAANLAWKLDRVLTGTSPDTLLDAYGTERAPNMEAVIELAIEMGKMICACDPDEVRARDDMFLAGRRRQHHRHPAVPRDQRRASSSPAHPEQASCSYRETSRETACACASTTPSAPDGASSPTARFAIDGDLAEWFPSIGGAVVAVGGESGLIDVDGTYGRWFAVNGVSSRPSNDPTSSCSVPLRRRQRSNEPRSRSLHERLVGS